MSLLNSLISYWALDEASGNAVDAHGSNTLTASNSPGSTTGLVYANARSVASASSQRFSVADNVALSTGNIDFTFAAWVYPTSFTSSNPWVGGKGVGANEEWRLDYFSARYRFAIHNSGTYRVATADNFGSPSTNQWHFIIGWHDAISDTVNIQVNNGTINSTATSATAPVDGVGAFGLASTGVGTAGTFFDGRIGPAKFWKRVLTSDERTRLYNSGNGLAYSAFATAQSRRRRFARGGYGL